MMKPKLIDEKDLPLKLLGTEKETYKEVFKITKLLNRDLMLSLKCSGYINQNAILQSGEVVESAWVK